jgi:ribosome assembly protein YihI (activator of Der GTPase)
VISRLYVCYERFWIANRKRGSWAERLRRSLSGQALKAMSRERAWLKGHQGVREGSKASRHMVSAWT